MRTRFLSIFRRPVLIVTLLVATSLSVATLAGFYPFAFMTTHTCTVTFAENGGSAVTDQVLSYSSVATEPTAPTKTCNTFVDWYSDVGLTSIYNFSTTCTANKTLYAKWSVNMYTVTFVENSGSAVTDQSVSCGGVATEPTTTRTGYTFVDWYSDSGLTTVYNFSTAVTANKTLYAKWSINSYTVTFNSGGGSAVTSQSIAYNSYATVPTSPTKSCNTFANWYSDAGLTSLYVFASTPVTGNITLYAKWTIINYTVTFSSGSGTPNPSSQSIACGSYASTPTSPALSCYTFNGWHITSPTGASYVFASTPVTGNITLYAGWTIINYTVTFDANGGSATSTQWPTCGGAMTLTSPVKSCNTFNGWHTGSPTGPLYVNSGVYSSFTLYAGWTQIYYTVSFALAGGTPAYSAQSIGCGNLATNPGSPTRSCFTFAGWNYNFATPITSATTVTASWTQIYYTATFNANGGTGGTGPTTYACGATVSVPTVTKSCYTFANWSPYSNPITSTFTATASWNQIYYTITLDANGGSGTTTKSVACGSYVGSYVWPTRSYYTFQHWGLCTGVCADYSTTTPVYSSYSIYAHWGCNPKSCITMTTVGYRGCTGGGTDVPTYIRGTYGSETLTVFYARCTAHCLATAQSQCTPGCCSTVGNSTCNFHPGGSLLVGSTYWYAGDKADICTSN